MRVADVDGDVEGVCEGADEGVDRTGVRGSDDEREVRRDVFGTEGACDSGGVGGKICAEILTDGRDFCTAAEQRAGAAGCVVSASDYQHTFSQQVNHHWEVWRTREKFILSVIMYTFIFSQGVRNFETSM